MKPEYQIVYVHIWPLIALARTFASHPANLFDRESHCHCEDDPTSALAPAAATETSPAHPHGRPLADIGPGIQSHDNANCQVPVGLQGAQSSTDVASAGIGLLIAACSSLPQERPGSLG